MMTTVPGGWQDLFNEHKDARAIPLSIQATTLRMKTLCASLAPPRFFRQVFLLGLCGVASLPWDGAGWPSRVWSMRRGDGEGGVSSNTTLT